jgi:hypothetical protein
LKRKSQFLNIKKSVIMETKKHKSEKNFIAYIAGNKYTKAFDTARGVTAKSAIAKVKQRNSPDWKDCVVWAERFDLPY